MDTNLQMRLMVPLASLALLAGGCGGGSGNASGLEGRIRISGSSTVEPISALNAEKFAEEHPGVAITVEGPGTGDGFELFCAGEIDIADASRPITQEEIAACAEGGISYTELEVAIDGIAVLTSSDDAGIECLAFGDLYALVGPESEGLANWTDAAPLAREVGGIAADAYPAQPLEITAPGEESGTYDSFVELTLETIAEERGHDPATRKDYVASANDNVIIEGIAGSAGSLGWVGYSFYVANQGSLRALAIDGGEGCVAPTEGSIADGSYPIARSLYLYVSDAAAADPSVAAYLDFFLSAEGIASVGEVGYVPLPLERIEATRSAWEEAKAA